MTSIGDRAFDRCTSLTSVTIPDSVTTIGKDAFFQCTGLTSVILPDSVTSIEESAFSECTSLTSVTIPAGVTNIGNWTFSECTSLTSVTIPDSVTMIGWGAFSECTSLTSVTIPAGVTNIGDWAFSKCTSLTSVTIPDSVTSISAEAFKKCEKLKNLTIFGYVIDATQYDWSQVSPSEVQLMLENKDYSVRMYAPTKYQFVARVFLQDHQPEAKAYIKKNINEILPYFIDIDDYATVKGLIESGEFVTEQNILPFIDKAIEHTQSGGDMQIQVLRMSYKNDHFSNMDPFKNIRF